MLRVMQGLTAGIPAVMALAFVRAGIDVFTTVKATLAVLAAVSVVWLVCAARPPRGRRLMPPVGFALAAAGLSAVLTMATLAAPSPLRALVGEAGRHSGAAVWIAGLCLAVATSIVARHDRGRALRDVTVVASLPVSIYALLQAGGADPLAWASVEGGPQVFATLGNADYLSAWLGMVLPLAVAAVLDDRVSGLRQVTAAVAGVLGFLAALVSGSLQGPVASVVGSAIVIAVWTRDAGWGIRRRRVAGLGVVALLTAGAVAALVAAAGSPAMALASAERSVEVRLPIWQAAWGMSGRQPILGVGPGHFGDYWFVERPDSAIPVPDDVVPASTAADLLDRPVDDAHAVPLQVAATAGWPAAMLWILVIGIAVARGVRAVVDPVQSDGMAVAGLLGAVGAVVVTQLVAVDVAPTTVTGWVLVGALAGAGGPGVVSSRSETARRRVPGRHDADAAPSALRPFGVAVATAAALGVSVAALLPLAADVVAGTAVAASRSGNTQAASARWLIASRLAPWERRYPAGHSNLLADQAAFDRALLRQYAAIRRAPRNRTAAVNLARLTAAAEGANAAVAAYDAVLAIDPRTPVLLAEAGANALLAGEPRRAVVLLRRAVETAPLQTGWLQRLREAERAADTVSG